MSRHIFHPLRAPLCALAFLAVTGIPAVAQGPAPGTARIHYYRPDGNYTGWGLYAWNATTVNYTWCSSQVAQTGTDSFGVYFDIPVNSNNGSPAGQLGFIINNCADNQLKDPGPNQYLQIRNTARGESFPAMTPFSPVSQRKRPYPPVTFASITIGLTAITRGGPLRLERHHE